MHAFPPSTYPYSLGVPQEEKDSFEKLTNDLVKGVGLASFMVVALFFGAVMASYGDRHRR